MIIALFIYLLSLVCWLGGMVFFSIFTAPVIFRVLDRTEAARVVAGIFPRYYLLGYVAGAIAFGLAIYLTVIRNDRLWWILSAIALAVALGLTIYAGGFVSSRIRSLNVSPDQPIPQEAHKAEFDRLHRLSVALNGGVIVLNLLALLSSAAALSNYGQF
jgi:Domain of unknown function (DUF4149)